MKTSNMHHVQILTSNHALNPPELVSCKHRTDFGLIEILLLYIRKFPIILLIRGLFPSHFWRNLTQIFLLQLDEKRHRAIYLDKPKQGSKFIFKTNVDPENSGLVFVCHSHWITFHLHWSHHLALHCIKTAKIWFLEQVKYIKCSSAIRLRIKVIF